MDMKRTGNKERKRRQSELRNSLRHGIHPESRVISEKTMRQRERTLTTGRNMSETTEPDSPEKPQLDSPEKPQLDSPEKPQLDSPEKPQLDSPNKPQLNNLEKPKLDIPVKPQLDSSKKPQLDSPKKPQLHSPKKPQLDNLEKPKLDSPVKPQLDSPKKPQLDSPKKPQLHSPKKPQLDNLEKPQLDSPVKPQLDSPVKPQLDSPVKPQLDIPEKDCGQDHPPGTRCIICRNTSSMDAFSKITIGDLLQVQEIKKKVSKSLLKRTRQKGNAPQTGSNTWNRANRRIAIRSSIEKYAGNDESDDNEEELKHVPKDLEQDLEKNMKGAEGWDVMQEWNKDDDVANSKKAEEAVSAREEANEENKGPTPKLGVMAAIKVQKWLRKSRKINKKNFAKSPEHHKLLTSMGNKFSIDTPIPMKILMYNDLIPILQTTVTEYHTQLGRRHHMTLQAESKVAELERWSEVLHNM